MDDNTISFGDLVSKTFKNIKCTDVENATEVFDGWKKVLYSIKGMANSSHPENPYEGQNLYEHSRIIDLKNGVLLIEADHPGWIQLLQMHKQYIIRGLNKFSPNLHINTLAFRLKGKKGELYDSKNISYSTEQVKDGIKKRVEKEEKMLNESVHIENQKNENEKDKKQISPELAVLFDDLKKSVLTNSKK